MHLGKTISDPPRAVCLPACSSVYTPTAAPAATRLSNVWGLTPSSSGSSQAVISLLTSGKWLDWCPGAAATTWSWMLRRQWRWSWTLGNSQPIVIPKPERIPHLHPGLVPCPGNHHPSESDVGITIRYLIKKSQRQMFFLWQLRKIKVATKMLVLIYTVIIERILRSVERVMAAGSNLCKTCTPPGGVQLRLRSTPLTWDINRLSLSLRVGNNHLTVQHLLVLAGLWENLIWTVSGSRKKQTTRFVRLTLADRQQLVSIKPSSSVSFLSGKHHPPLQCSVSASEHAEISTLVLEC